MVQFWNAAIYDPLYNILIAFVALVPTHDVGLAIIFLTIAVKFALFPLTKNASIAQRAMKEIEPEMKALREKYADNKEELSRRLILFYKEKKVSPFSGCLPMLIQIPIVIALYMLFLKGLTLDQSILYSFTPRPEHLDLHFFLGDLAGKSLFLAALAGATQYLQTKLMLPKQQSETRTETTKKPSFQEEFQKSMNIQMLYMFPVLIGFVSYTTSAAVALYFVVGNIFGIGQEYYIRKSGGGSKRP
jgi:YidC/Oxa1 family membrane protein insertase